MTTRSRSELVGGALALAAEGIPVIPLRPRSKVPLNANWPKLGDLDPDSIRLTWELHPDANVGVLGGHEAFGGAGLTIVDVDLPDGPGTLEALIDRHGALPFTSAVETPSGGMHYYLRGSTASWNPGPGLEVRSAGRQCAAPPSVLRGGAYSWFQRTTLAQLPDWLRRRDRDAVQARRAMRPRPGGPSPPRLSDPVLEVPPPEYFRALCGLVPDRDGFVCCPIHGEQEASLKVYDTAERGWFCYGESCRRGGDVVTLVAYLAGVEPPVRGYQFVALLEYLRGRLT